MKRIDELTRCLNMNDEFGRTFFVGEVGRLIAAIVLHILEDKEYETYLRKNVFKIRSNLPELDNIAHGIHFYGDVTYWLEMELGEIGSDDNEAESEDETEDDEG